MFIAIMNGSVPGQAQVAQRLETGGFRRVELRRSEEEKDDWLARASQVWGPACRVRQVLPDVDALVNHVFVGVMNLDELVELTRLQPTGVLWLGSAPSPGFQQQARERGIPWSRVPDEDVAKGDRIVWHLMEVSRQLPRVSWDEYFMSIARIVAARSDCVKRRVAALIVKDRRIISTGYNGTPRHTKNCGEGGCERCASFGPSGKDLGECLCSHGEENAITQAAFNGTSIAGATIYCTTSPCLLCTKLIINSGMGEVVYNAAYPLGGRSLALLTEAAVRHRQL